MQYILVHGSWHGGWCWTSLATELCQRGHRVSCPDLPGHGSSTFPLSEVTYDICYQKLVEEIHKYEEPIIIVAHSMSGILAAPLLDQYPDRISHLFLIAAFVAQNGQSLLDIALAGGPSEIPQLIITDEKNNTQKLNLQRAKEALYHDCPSEVTKWALPQLRPQPTCLITFPVNWKDSGNTKQKRTYLLCEEDRDVHITTQKSIIQNYPCHVISIKSGHFPFLSQPKKVAEILENLL